MKQNWKKGWLVTTVALMMGMTMSMTSCSSDDALTEPAVPAATATAQKVHVSVGAGINGNQTRSTVTTVGGVRSLSFTEGDRIYVRAVIAIDQDELQNDHEKKIMAGYLNIDPSNINGTSATFSGDLNVYEGDIVTTAYDQVWVVDAEAWDEDVIDSDENGNPISSYTIHHEEEGHWEDDYSMPTSFSITSYYDSTHEFNDPANPLSECISVNAVLVHKDAGDHFVINSSDKTCEYQGDMASDVETLMTSYLNVTADVYNSEKHGFDFSSNSPILNCTISGLTANSTYTVSYLRGASESAMGERNLGTVTTDGDGKATFAFFGTDYENYYHALRFKKNDVSEWEYLNLGKKSLTNKVYNVTKSVAKEPLATPITFEALAQRCTSNGNLHEA